MPGPSDAPLRRLLDFFALTSKKILANIPNGYILRIKKGKSPIPKEEENMFKYKIIANGTILGIYEASCAQEARDLCAQDAGYSSEEDMENRLEQPSELEAEVE